MAKLTGKSWCLSFSLMKLLHNNFFPYCQREWTVVILAKKVISVFISLMLVDLVNKFVSILKWHHCLINNMDGMESISNYFNASKEREFNDGSIYSLSYNLTPAISRVLIDRHLVFCSPTWPTCCNSTWKCTPVKYKATQKAGFPIIT